MASSNNEGWPDGFWSRPPPRWVVFWVCVVVVVMLTQFFWPTVIVLLLSGLYACRRLVKLLSEPPRPAPRRRM